MKIRSHHIAAFLLAGAVFLSSIAWYGFKAPNVYATCSAGSGVSITSPVASTTVRGNITFSATTTANVTSTYPSSVTFAFSSPATSVIGNGTQQSATGTATSWTLPWNTTSRMDGAYQVVAIAHYGTTVTNDCSSNPIAFNITNGTTAAPTISIALSPNTWTGGVNQKQIFTVDGTYKDQTGAAYSLNSAGAAVSYNWTTSAGTLTTPTGRSTTLTTGPTLGLFNINVVVKFNGLTSSFSSPIRITAPTAAANTTTAAPKLVSPSPAPNTATTAPATQISQIGVGGTTPLTPAEITQLTTTPTVFRPIKPTNAAPVVPVPILGCMKEKIGNNYTAISDGTAQPTITDRLNASTCFSGSDKIPATIAPVAPTRIDEVTTSTSIVKLDSIKNATITNPDGKKANVLFLTGSSVPNSSVFLYFFSDPMVLRAETDNSGKYSYVLQNPLAPGKHEVYAVAAKDKTAFVRTQALPITVAAAASDGQNGSLIIESKLQPIQVGFIAASLLMIIVAIFILFRMVRQSKPKMITPTVAYSTTSLAMPSGSVALSHPAGTVIMPAKDKDSPLAPPPPTDNQNPAQ